MKNFSKRTILASAAALMISGMLSGPAMASDHGMKHGKMMVDDAWARARTATAKVAGAFMKIHNMTGKDDRLVDAKTTISDRVELHTTEMQNGVMKMIHMKEGIEVGAGKVVMMKPGGYHVMFMGLKEQLTEGKTFPVTLVFEKAGEVAVTVTVKKGGAMGGMNHGKMDHGNMKHGDMKHEQMKKKMN